MLWDLSRIVTRRPWPRILAAITCLGCGGTALGGVRLVQKKPPRTYALVVGINTYEDSTLSRLRTAEREAQTIFEALTSPATGLVARSDAVLLLGSLATRQNISGALAKARQHLTPNDSLIVYWAGYSAFSEAEQEVYLAPHDVRATTDLKAGMALVRDLIVPAHTPEGDFIFIGDGCNIGTGFVDRMDRFFARVGVLSSSKDDEVALETREGSWFAAALHDALVGTKPFRWHTIGGAIEA